jgi:hypothetical protein
MVDGQPVHRPSAMITLDFFRTTRHSTTKIPSDRLHAISFLSFNMFTSPPPSHRCIYYPSKYIRHLPIPSRQHLLDIRDDTTRVVPKA